VKRILRVLRSCEAETARLDDQYPQEQGKKRRQKSEKRVGKFLVARHCDIAEEQFEQRNAETQ
jgi:hypothetical protein